MLDGTTKVFPTIPQMLLATYGACCVPSAALLQPFCRQPACISGWFVINGPRYQCAWTHART